MLTRALSYLDRTVELAIFVIFVVMVLIGGMQVFNRFVLNQSLSWSEEFQKFAHIWLIFFTIAVGYNRGSHIGMNIVVGRFPRRLQHLLILISDLLWLGLAVAIVRYTTVIMGVAKRQTSPGLGVRMDLVYLSLVLGGGYLAIVAVRKIVGSIRLLTSDQRGGEASC
ncbi:TRAP transporter small permease subunit [candidate division KSB3 bacterium]|jgi:TRAP-type C4-dicarboxylate transport system permease small subunit|uniref:TRAP transporter small permease subunit n=1 Tax=candidate division KSB3 bacterium TaxID=2044937 RepID=A0A9D5JZK9_9BACT|nr:TRAP transporter small permease subunit [candidate division KSB3 bacterium]MBD3326886.1 TRAP transporter small permease subunit [candidate division KSB3 bacterium]